MPHNGGRSQVNLYTLQRGGFWPFLNLLKGGQTWAVGSEFPDPTTLNAQGYPTSLPSGSVFTVFYIPNQTDRPGNYVIKWVGNGTVGLSLTHTAVSGSLSGNNGRYEFTPTAAPTVDNQVYVLLSINAVVTPFTDLIFCHVDDEARIDAGERWSPKFLERLRQLNPGVIRFMDWQGTNASIQTSWAYRRPLDYWTYHGGWHAPDLYKGETTTDNDGAYSIAGVSTTPADKESIIVRYNKTCQFCYIEIVSGKLRVTSRKIGTASSIAITDGNLFSSLTDYSAIDSAVAGTASTAGYQEISFSSAKSGSSSTGFANNSTAYTFSVLIDGTRTINVSVTGSSSQNYTNLMSSVSPFFRDQDPTLNGIPVKTRGGDRLFSVQTPQAGKYGAHVYDADLNVWMKLGGDFEGSASSYWGDAIPIELMVDLCNEVGAHPWFCIPAYACDPLTDFTTELATYCRDNLDEGLVPRFEPSNEVWNSASGFMQTFYAYNKANAAWGTSFDVHNWYGRALSRVGEAVSAVYGDDRTRYQVICAVQTYGATSTSTPRLSSARYVTDGGTPASQWATHVAPTNYWSPRYYQTATETGYATEYASATEARKLEILTQYVTEGQSDLAAYTIGNMLSRVQAWKSWANGYGLGVTFYEGGFSPDYTTFTAEADSTTVDALRSGAKSVAALGTMTTSHYNDLLELGCEFPSCFTFSSTLPWSIQDPTIYSADSAQFTAIAAFNAVAEETDDTTAAGALKGRGRPRARRMRQKAPPPQPLMRPPTLTKAELFDRIQRRMDYLQQQEDRRRAKRAPATIDQPVAPGPPRPTVDDALVELAAERLLAKAPPDEPLDVNLLTQADMRAIRKAAQQAIEQQNAAFLLLSS